MEDDLSRLIPLAPAALHILLALSREDRHGYGIMQEIKKHSDGQYKIGPGTLYDNLEKLLNLGMLVEAPKKRRAEEDERRRYYGLTSFGRRVLAADVRRLERVVRTAKTNLRQSAPQEG
jgi:DNA-binding PadR family transcriptional regulator